MAHDPLSALFINCTLKPSPQTSNTDGLMNVVRAVMETQGVTVETVRAVDYDIAPGVQTDMREHGFERDDWPMIQQKVLDADILVIGTPIWCGEKSSVCTRVIERLYGWSGELNDKGQSIFYGRAAGCVVTGNEDGAKHCAMNLIYSLQHIGFCIPPQADCAWVGEAGPGPSYCDDGSGGPENDFTQRNAVFMAWNLMHMAKLLKAAGGFPNEGNDRRAWKAGARFGHPNPEYR